MQSSMRCVELQPLSLLRELHPLRRELRTVSCDDVIEYNVRSMRERERECKGGRVPVPWVGIQ